MAGGSPSNPGGSRPTPAPKPGNGETPGFAAGRGVEFGFNAPVDLLSAIAGAGGQIEPRISRAEALQVPAVLRGRNMIAGTLATLPVHVIGTDRREVRSPLLEQIDPDVPNSVTLAAIFEDLVFEGISWLRIVEFRGGFPSKAQHVPPQSVTIGDGSTASQWWISPDQRMPVDGKVYVDGVHVPDDQLIRFDSPNPPFLVHSARAIRAALQLDQTAAQNVRNPMPLGYFAPTDGADPAEDTDIQTLLNEWEAARRLRSTGYVPAALSFNALQWDPKQLQLAEQRQHAVLEISRGLGIDPEDLGVSTTSRTYQNGEQRRQALLDFTLGAYVSAFQDRLSMGDVTPRGQLVRMKFDGFLRSDTLTRMQAYQIGLPIGAYTVEEIRDLEDKAPLTPAQISALTPTAPATEPTGAPPMHLVPPLPAVAEFAGAEDETTVILMATDDATAASFKVNRETRTIAGLAIPWDVITSNGWAKWTFEPGSLHWSQDSRVKLDMDHDPTQTIGRASTIKASAAGLETSFKVARGAEGDRALSLAEDGVYDGLSVAVHFEDGDKWTEDSDGVRHVSSATLRRVALTPTPAYDDARVTSVAASRRNTLGAKMKCTKCGKVHADGVTECNAADLAAFKAAATGTDMERFAAVMAEKFGEHNSAALDKLAESVTAGIVSALENIEDPQELGRQSVRASRFKVTSEPPVYSLNGAGFSLVRDAWYAGREKETDAIERLRKYRQQTEEVAKLAAAQTAAQFATSTTGTSGQIIPPGYRPDLYVNQLQQGRPLVAMCSQGVIANATPFTVPVFQAVANATADHVEGVNPTDGTLTFGTKTVTPGGISGRLVLTREIVDSSNPAIDQIALASMRESYDRQTEGKVYTLLNGANGAGGTITTGFVPSGAQASTYVGATGTPPAAIAGIRKELARYPFNRFAMADAAAVGQNAAQILSGAVDSTGRPLFPWVSLGGAQNVAGVAMQGGWMVDNMLLVPAWAMTGTAAGDSQIFVLKRSDAWVWESSLLSFRFEEKSGPALIELALFGYFGAHVLRPVGLSGIRLT